MGVLDRLAGATPRTRTETVCLDGELEDQHRHLAAKLDDAILADEQAVTGSLTNPTPHLAALVEELEAIREKIRQAEVIFTFAQIPWDERVDLQAAHPPRKGNLVDEARGWDHATFVPALVRACLASVTDADGDTATADQITDETWMGLLSALNHRQMSRLFAAAWDTTDGESKVPPSARSLLVSQDSGASLARPGPGTSVPVDSAGGSPRGSRKSSATSKAGRSGS